jgi:hypothetical protein
MDSMQDANRSLSGRNALLGDRVLISKEVEKSCGVFIDIHSELPLVISYGEIRVLNSNSEDDTDVIGRGGLCFFIDGGYSFGESKWKKRISSISMWLGHDQPEITFFELPFFEYKRFYRQSGQRSYTLHDVEREVRDFFSVWSRSKEKLELRGDEKELTLFIYCEKQIGPILEIKLQTKKDYYAVAAWVILLAANKYIRDDDQARIFEEYWPSCRYYYKPYKPTPTKDESEAQLVNEKEQILSTTYEADLLMREHQSPLPFSRLLLQNCIYYYSEDGKPYCICDINIVNVQYGDGSLQFDCFSRNIEEQLSLNRDFTYAPFLCVTSGNETKLSTISRLGKPFDSYSEKHIRKAECVNAPYNDEYPIVLECRLSKRAGKYPPHFEAIVFKTHIAKSICDKEGSLLLQKAWNHMALEWKYGEEDNKQDE